MTTDKRLLATVERQVLEDNFKLFVQQAWSHIDPEPFVDGFHIDYICDHLQALYEDRIQPGRVLVNIPPGCAKSLLISVMFPAWVWTRDPTKSFISASHSQDFSMRDSLKMRRLIEGEWYQKRWPIKLRGDQNEKRNFENEQGGSRTARPFGSITGGRADYVLIDDPHTVDTAESGTERASVVRTFLEAIPSRLKPRGKIVVVMQRLHEEDVSGAILDRPKLGYTHLCLPMEFEGNKEPTCIGWVDPREEEGELLIPTLESQSQSRIDEAKESLGPVAYAGQFQQRPVPREAGEIDVSWFNRYELGQHPKGCYFYLTSDHAPSGNSKSDYNVFMVWGIDSKRDLYLVDVFRKRCFMDEAFGINRDENGKMQPTPFGALSLIRRHKITKFFPEKDGTWHAIESLFKSALRETRTHVVIDPQSPHGLGDKIAKAQPFVAIAGLRRVHIPKGEMGNTFIDECRRFPNGKHDDQVDAAAMIARVYNKLLTGRDMTPKEREPAYWDYVAQTVDESDSDTFW